MQIKTRASMYLYVSLVLGALTPIMFEIATKMNIYEFVFLVYLLAVPSSIAFVFIRKKQDKLIKYLKDRRVLAILALIGIAYYAPFEFGLTYVESFSSVSLATVMYRMQPLLMLLFLPILLRERITKYQVAALSLAFIGILIAVTGGTLSVFTGSSISTVALLLGITLSGALATIYIKKYAMYDMESSMCIFAIANFLLFSALYVANGMPTMPALNSGDIAAILFMGVYFNVINGFIYYSAFRVIKTTFFTNVYLFSPFITLIMAHFILGEAIQAYYVIIAVMVAAGLLIQNYDKKGSTYLAKSKSDAMNCMTIFDVTGAFSNTGEVAINNAIAEGGRMLAVKLPESYTSQVRSMAKSTEHANVYTDAHASIQSESKFVKDILGVGEGEFVVMKAGKPEECEGFFEELQNKVTSTSDDAAAE